MMQLLFTVVTVNVATRSRVLYDGVGSHEGLWRGECESLLHTERAGGSE